VLQKCLNSNNVNKVTSIVRKASGLKHSKLNEIVHTDFLDYTSIREVFKNQDIAFYCIGVYTGAVLRDEFRKITVDYTLAFAKMLRSKSDNTTFCFLSGQGADQSEKSKMMFAMDKGIAENALQKMQFNQFYTFRAGYIYPSTPRLEPNVSYKIMKVLYKPVSIIYPNIGISSENLASAIVEVGCNGYLKSILENRDIRSIIGVV
jgi:hypothetical protein